MNLTNRYIAVPIVLAALLFTSGCATPPLGSAPEAGGPPLGAIVGTAVGTGAGATAGYFIGRASGQPLFGAIAGGIIGGALGSFIGGITDQQRAALAANSPHTLAVIQHNDAVMKQQKQPVVAQTNPEEKAPRKKKVTPLSVDDVTALAAAGVKPDVIIKAIGESKAVYTPNQIAKAQQASPAVDPSVINYMQKTNT